MIIRFRPQPQELQRLEVGPIGPHIRSFADLIAKQNYSCGTGWVKLRLVARFSRWLQRHRITLKKLDEVKIQKFLNERWKKLARHAGDQITMDLLVRHLREIHAAPPKRATEGSEMDLLRLDYQTFLLEERSLFHSTCAVYLNVVRRFLARCFPDGKIHLNRLQAKDVVDFVLHDTSNRGSKERRLGTPFPEKSLGNEWQKLETKSRRNGQCNGHLRRIGSKSVPRWHPGVAADKDALREAVTTGYLKSRVMI